MKKVLVILIMGMFLCYGNARAQEFYAAVGSGMSVDGEINLYFTLPSIEFAYIKNISPRLHFSINPYFANYSMADSEWNTWRLNSGNIVIPVALRWQLAGKALSIGIQPYVGFNLYTNYFDSNDNKTALNHNSAFFGIPIGNFVVRRGQFYMHASLLEIRWNFFDLDSFPMNPFTEDDYSKTQSFVTAGSIRMGMRIK